jgi:hypothetical protein
MSRDAIFSSLITDLSVAQAAHLLKLDSPGDLIRVAESAVLAGLASPSLLALAGLVRSEEGEAPELFARALSELKMADVTAKAAALLLARIVCTGIVVGTLPPYEGARLIWRIARRVSDADFHELDGFIYAASEYEDRPEDREHFSTEILSEARRWAQAPRSQS